MLCIHVMMRRVVAELVIVEFGGQQQNQKMPHRSEYLDMEGEAPAVLGRRQN